MQTIKAHWRPVLAALPLPMLALAASYGVYSYALLFVPTWVAVVQASAFEMTYVGLSVLRVGDAQRRRARLISGGAVVVSIIYNSLAGLFHRAPGLLDALPMWGETVLAVLHGLPLALVAFLVADLLLHQEPAHKPVVARADRAVMPKITADAPEIAAAHEDTASEHIETVRPPATDRTCRYCGEGGLTIVDVMTHGRVRKSTGSCGRVASAD